MMSRTFTTLALVAFTVASAAAQAQFDFTGFVKHVEPRQTEIRTSDRHIPASPTERLHKQAKRNTTPTMFAGWNEADPARPMLAPRQVNEGGEKMDSIVGHYLDGRLMSKQTFEYTETGRPLVCRNYTAAPDGESYQLDGYYAYEYDNQGRLITATKVSATDTSVMMEYVYEGDMPVYSMQIAYMPDSTGEWVPFQKGEYEVDANYNTTRETFYSWGSDMDWVPALRNEATYDEMDRLTSYFPYIWDGNTWVGNQTGFYEGQRFAYTQNGDDAQQIDYTWENNDWLEYKHIDYTYNDAALLTLREELYWNREKQDWSGGDGYGQWGDKKYNSRDCYEYDEYGRVVLNDFYRKKKTDDYVNIWRAVYEYNPLGDNVTEKISLEANIPSSGVFTPERKTVEHTTADGYEIYYAIYRAVEGELTPEEEIFRYLMPEYNWYLGFESFRYEDGKKVPSGKEEFLYADDFDPAAGYETPYEGRHYRRGAEGLVLTTIDRFTWGPRDVMTEYIDYDCTSGTPLRVYGWDVEYDFSADCSKIFMWPDANKGAAFYENKNISSNTYYNPAYYDGTDEWDLAISSHLDYYYSARQTGVEAIVNPDAVEVARYDVAGRRLSAPVRGINIIVYSDGTSRKVML
ncbi:MAG: hypothetical protein K2K26_02180 [Muribaculaceae bacterium]|nr:hypothetical protein [Muribaculaceae bacterium]